MKLCLRPVYVSVDDADFLVYPTLSLEQQSIGHFREDVVVYIS